MIKVIYQEGLKPIKRVLIPKQVEPVPIKPLLMRMRYDMTPS